MKPDANRNRIIIALKKAIVSSFDDANWRELGYLTDTIDMIQGDRRLLRSLQWGDDDYEGRVITMIPRILGENFEKLEIIEEYVGLENWLKNHDAPLFAELYGTGDTPVPLEDVEGVASRLDVIEINRHAARIRHSLRDDPEQALGSAKELLESVLKAVLNVEGERAGDDIPTLLRQAQRELDLDPKAVGEDVPGKETIRRTLSNLGQVVIGVAEVRNLYGTGHGRHKSRELEIAHARLVVNAAVTLATFLAELAHERGF